MTSGGESLQPTESSVSVRCFLPALCLPPKTDLDGLLGTLHSVSLVLLVDKTSTILIFRSKSPVWTGLEVIAAPQTGPWA